MGVFMSIVIVTHLISWTYECMASTKFCISFCIHHRSSKEVVSHHPVVNHVEIGVKFSRIKFLVKS